MVLLLVFSLNTAVSFACSLGGIFHAFHHQTRSAEQKNGHRHHNHQEGHQHGHGGKSYQHEEQPSSQPDDDCCSRNVVEVEKLEKAVSRTIQAPDAVFLTSFLSACSSLFSHLPVEGKTHYPNSIRWRLPATIQDLRIVIQSFQI